MDDLGDTIAALKRKGLGPVSITLLVFEAGEMERIMALIGQFRLSAEEFPLVRDYVTLRMTTGTGMDQVIRDLERILTTKGNGGGL